MCFAKVIINNQLKYVVYRISFSLVGISSVLWLHMKPLDGTDSVNDVF